MCKALNGDNRLTLLLLSYLHRGWSTIADDVWCLVPDIWDCSINEMVANGIYWVPLCSV